MAQNGNKIELGHALTAAALAMSAMAMWQEWSGAADQQFNKMADRICRLEAIAGVGECKR
jgi:hypothetical protein